MFTMRSQLNIQTHSRTEFISLFAQVAECFPLSAFHNREDVPVITITGDVNSGKSLVAETMMKTWSPIAIQSWSEMQKMFWGQMGAKPAEPKKAAK